MPKLLATVGALLCVGVGVYLLQTNANNLHNDSVTFTDDTAIVVSENVPRHLQRIFPETDFSNADPALIQALPGGPEKDGIPALDKPTFVPLDTFPGSNDIQAIVLDDNGTRKVYPYNILTWHEIVNDTVADTPVAITFCPLCGSAIVFNRTLPDGQVTTFGISGSLLESNMIMFDRATESLWQQSTGKTLAGAYHESQLTIEPFQLSTLGDVRENYPEAMVLSTDTGYRRDYTRNPYAGYETDDRFIFEPSNIDRTYNPKEIMVVFLTTTEAVATLPWNQLREAGVVNATIDEVNYTLSVDEQGELSISSESGATLPFYYEMWFSVAVQHNDAVTLISVE
jgi:hypothetical protein